MDKQLKGCRPEWTEIISSKMNGKQPIRFVPKVTEYDNDHPANSFSLSLNLNSIPDVIQKKRNLKLGEEGSDREPAEKEWTTDGTIHQVLKYNSHYLDSYPNS